MDNAKSDMDWKGGEMTEDMRERKQQQRIYAAIVDSLIEQNSPDSVSGMKIMDAITPYLALSSAGTSGTVDAARQAMNAGAEDWPWLGDSLSGKGEQ